MEAYKIKSTIERLCGGNQWTGPTDIEITSDKEYYHLKKEDAIKHIASYINVCKDKGIILEKKNDYTWEAYTNWGSTYTVKLSKIDIL